MLGEFEQLVLLAVVREGEDAYGVPIRRAIVDRSGRDVSLAAVYKTLTRLEEKGLVTSRLGDPTPQRGGRAKRFFRVTAKGVQAISRAQRAYQRLLQGLTLERGGRRKRYYTITAAGRRSRRQSVDVLRRMARGLDLGLDIP